MPQTASRMLRLLPHCSFISEKPATPPPTCDDYKKTAQTIYSARASFTVVPTASATAPYLAAAPTTELVSWIASAAHRPN